MEYDFSSIEEQEAHFELTQDTFLRKEREKNKIEKLASEQSDIPKDFAQVLNDNFMDLI